MAGEDSRLQSLSEMKGTPGPSSSPEPDQRLGSAARIAWTLQGVAVGAGLGLLLAIALPVLGNVDGLPGWVQPAVAAIAGLAAVTAVLVRPQILAATWRYAVREEEIDLRHGWLLQTRTIVPAARVQHVDTQRSFWGQLLDLSTLRIHTAAGTNHIPHLKIATADRLRDDIARRAHIPDEL